MNAAARPAAAYDLRITAPTRRASLLSPEHPIFEEVPSPSPVKQPVGATTNPSVPPMETPMAESTAPVVVPSSSTPVLGDENDWVLFPRAVSCWLLGRKFTKRAAHSVLSDVLGPPGAPHGICGTGTVSERKS